MISSKVIKAALETSHATCDTPEGCIHADGLAANHDLMNKDIMYATLGGLEIGGPKFVAEAVYNAGFHAGYRAAMLQAEIEASKVKAA